MGFTAVEIPLHSGDWALIDIEDAPRVLQYSWNRLESGQTMVYARARTHVGGRNCPKILMHRLIVGAKPDQDFDHRDGNGLNNRRCNLRPATVSQNLGNMRRVRSDNTSGFKGVTFSRQRNRWHARIQVDGKRMHLGFFSTKESAAKAYDEAAKRLFGEFAALNSEIAP